MVNECVCGGCLTLSAAGLQGVGRGGSLGQVQRGRPRPQRLPQQGLSVRVWKGHPEDSRRAQMVQLEPGDFPHRELLLRLDLLGLRWRPALPPLSARRLFGEGDALLRHRDHPWAGTHAQPLRGLPRPEGKPCQEALYSRLIPGIPKGKWEGSSRMVLEAVAVTVSAKGATGPVGRGDSLSGQRWSVAKSARFWGFTETLRLSACPPSPPLPLGCLGEGLRGGLGSTLSPSGVTFSAFALVLGRLLHLAEPQVPLGFSLASQYPSG